MEHENSGQDYRAAAEVIAADADRVFAELCEADAQKLYNRAKLFLGDAEEARDLVQDVLLEFWRNLHAGKIASNPRACLFGLLRNRALDRLRARNRRPLHVSLTPHKGLEEGLDLQLRTSDGEEDRMVIAAQLAQGLPTLSVPEQVIVAGVVAGHKDQEIASDLGVNTECLKKQRQRLLRRLRAWFAPPPEPQCGD